MAYKVKVTGRDEDGIYTIVFAGTGLRYSDKTEIEVEAAKETHTKEELLGDQELLNAKLKAIEDYDTANPIIQI